MNDDAPPLRDFNDRFFRESLKNPDNLREFLTDVVPELVGGFDFTRVKFVERTFRLPDWREREADLLFEIPYRLNDVERIALVCVLIEHQTNPDPRMPLRMLIEVVLQWERYWREWEERESPKVEFRLPPVLPIVLHAGHRAWTTARTLGEMLGPPDCFHDFAPVWKPIFWELEKHSPEELLDANQAFLQVLAVVRMEEAEREEFGRVFSEAFRRLEAEHGKSRVRWTELVQLMFAWIFHRRPGNEQADWVNQAKVIHENDVRKAEEQNMVTPWQETGFGVAYMKGFNEGIRQSVTLLLRQGQKRFGPISAETQESLFAIHDADRLGQMAERMLDVKSWTELLETE